MTTPMLGDVVAVARVLHASPEEKRAELLDNMLVEAGRSADLFGDRSLLSIALRHGRINEPALSDSDYCRCLIWVLEAVADSADTHHVRKCKT